MSKDNDAITNPSHYATPSGVEVIDILDELDLSRNLDRSVEYIARSSKKNGGEDLKKSLFYLIRECVQVYSIDQDVLHTIISESTDKALNPTIKKELR